MDRTVFLRLFSREQSRREALWRLEGIAPGESYAAPVLAVLDEIEALDASDPIGEGVSMSTDDLRGTVEVIKIEGRIAFVRDSDIPEPWLQRLTQAGSGSTRYPEGFFAGDWFKFLDLWSREMAFLDEHKKARAKALA